VRAHEFHYARLENLAPDLRYAWKVRRGDGITGADDGVVVGNTLASFAHLRDTSRFDWAARFVAFVRARRDRRRAEAADDRAAAQTDAPRQPAATTCGGPA